MACRSKVEQSCPFLIDPLVLTTVSSECPKWFKKKKMNMYVGDFLILWCTSVERSRLAIQSTCAIVNQLWYYLIINQSFVCLFVCLFVRSFVVHCHLLQSQKNNFE